MQQSVRAEDWPQVLSIIYEARAKCMTDSQLDYLDGRLEQIMRDSSYKLKKSKNPKGTTRVVMAKDIYKSKEWPTQYKPNYRLDPSSLVTIYNDDPVLSINWHLYKQVLERASAGYLIDKYEIERRLTSFKELKELSTFALKNGPAIGNHWSLLVGLDMLHGWEMEMAQEDMSERIEAWVNNSFKPTLNGSAADYLTQFRLAVRETLNWKDGQQEQRITIEQFAANIPLTSTTGSAFDPNGTRLRVTVDDEEVKVSNNKFSKSAALSVANKVGRLTKHSPQKAKVSVKIESKGKVRLIISADYNSTIRMRFIDTWLTKWMASNPNSTLWQNKKQTLKMWTNFAQQGDWNLPLDQSAFDHHVSKDMVMIMLDEIKLLITERCNNNSELLTVMEVLIDSFNDLQIYYTDPNNNKKAWQWRSGVLSGWQWTAFFDTLANVAEAKIALKTVSVKANSDIKPIQFNAQGDDQLNKFKHLTDGLLYWFELMNSNFVIHPSKNFFSKIHNEYLRKYSEEDGINGYPARLINRMCWQYPGANEHFTVIEKLNQIWSRWEKLEERLKLPNGTLMKYRTGDYSRSKIDKRLIKAFSESSRVDGGKSDNPIGNGIKIETIPGTWQYHLTVHGKGFQQFKQIYGEYQERAIDDWILQVTGTEEATKKRELKSEPVEVLQEVETVMPLEYFLVRDDPGISKPQLKEEGWVSADIFQASDKLMEKLFPDVKNFLRWSNAPKSWAYDYILGTLRYPLPRVPRMSEEAVGLVFDQYKNSLDAAMVHKRTVPEKWRRLLVYTAYELPKILMARADLPAMFVL